MFAHMSTRKLAIAGLLALSLVSTVACDSASSTPTAQHSETIVQNPDGSTSWHVQNEPAYVPPTQPDTAPCISCLITQGQGPMVNVSSGQPVPNAEACAQNPTMIGCPSVPTR